MPLPGMNTSVLAVPKSIAISLEKKLKNLRTGKNFIGAVPY
jgi:hypothetical protein